jgi:hypothetical protein
MITFPYSKKTSLRDHLFNSDVIFVLLQLLNCPYRMFLSEGSSLNLKAEEVNKKKRVAVIIMLESYHMKLKTLYPVCNGRFFDGGNNLLPCMH